MAKALKVEIVTDYLERFPGLFSLTLAKKIYNENFEVFKDVEEVRGTVRRYRGKHGKSHRVTLKDKRFYDQKPSLPESEAENYEPFIIPKAQDNILILSDLHIPYQDNEAIQTALDWGKEHEINTILLNGDILDCYQLSRFIKDPRLRSMAGELEDAIQFLEYLKSEFPSAVIYWKVGNHEERIENYLKVKAPELLDVSDFKLSVLMEFGARGIHCITDKRKVVIGKLTVLHGHEFHNKSAGSVNPARTLFLKTHQSAVVAHSHICSEHTDKRLDGDIITCWSVGCLCGLTPDYARINRWGHGFARVKQLKDGNFRVNNIRIINGKIY